MLSQDTAVGTEPSTIEACGDLLLADTWQRERQKRIVWVGGHGRFCPGMGVASTTKPYAIPAVCTMPICESLLCSE
jgi:hypothetical protein